MTGSYREVLKKLDRALGEPAATVLGQVRHGDTTHPLSIIVLGRGAPRRALISAGIHGDEPAGVMALAEFFERGCHAEFASDWELTIIPCINPHGFDAATRTNPAGEDLNREFKAASPPREVALVQSVFSGKFDLSLELHEDVDSSGYYLYQKTQADTGRFPGDGILSAVSRVLPIHPGEEIDGMPAERGMIQPLSGPEEMEWWPMALYSLWKGTEICLTLETPTRFPPAQRTEAHISAITAALRTCRV